ncbi:MAG: DUF6320 domain-containing protein [Lachnospiraceae bacterium]|nr:DUF6320 domain-containing protein [Lachnospiraceae bacterium]
MSEFEYSQWRKLDNAALAFPAATGKNDTRVFRFYCQLKEQVDGELLQSALDRTMEKYPLFQAVLRKGLFWFYLERRDIRAMVSREQKPPCSKLYIRDQKSLLFEVTYFEDKINFEVFHALTDGTGAMHFLQELVKNYLMLAHPETELPELEQDAEVTGKDQEEDSFSQYYSTKKAGEREKGHISAVLRNAHRNGRRDLPPSEARGHFHAVQLKGERLAQDEMRITELKIPVKEILGKARAYGVSITVFIAAALLYAIHEEVPVNRLRRPIALMVPVNLRNYYPSRSMANFFGWIEVGYEFSEDTVFSDVVADVKKQFERELAKERIASRMNALVRLEKNPFLRVVPLEVKQFFLMAGTSLGARNFTAVYSNMGIVKMPEEYSPYIDSFHLFASTENLQLCSCSYGDELMLGFTSKLPAENIQRNFMRLLKEEHLPYREQENRFPGYKKEHSESGKTIFQIYTFVCIAAAVLCGMINVMIEGRMSWSLLAAAGIVSAWLLTIVAYKKRRNLLKNGMWLLLFASVIGILWDSSTGWRGWSVDFLLPIASLTVLGSMPVIIKVQHLEKQEYLFYLVQCCAFGFIPLVLLLAGVVRIPYPSILCAGISILVLAGLFIFENRDTVRELHKKFRM